MTKKCRRCGQTIWYVVKPIDKWVHKSGRVDCDV